MLHLRIIAPPTRTGPVRDLLAGHDAVTNIVLVPGCAVSPPGDLVTADVAREAASAVLGDLRALGLGADGSVTVETLDLAESRGARRAKAAAPGHGSDAIVWEQVEAETQAESTFSVIFAVFMIVATVLAGVGVLLDSPILVIGAMVVGPEFGPLAGLSVAAVQRRTREAARSLFALVAGFPLGILATVLTTWLLDGLGLVERSMLVGPRPLTEFIWNPDALSFVVAFLAGIAGMLSLTSAKSGALVGVLISVTTIPAAGNVAVALAYGDAAEAGGSLLQLVLNVSGILLAGVLTLQVQRLAWRRWGVRRRVRASRR